MSGGSYNDLYHKDTDSILSEIDELKRMRDRLVELDYLDAAKETESLILVIKSFYVQSETIISRLNKVWKSVECMDSSDLGMEEVKESIKEYRS